MATILSRRRFLSSTALAGIAASMLPALGAPAAEPSLETTTIKLPRSSTICIMAQMITEQLLQAEGFTDIHYEPHGAAEQLARGDVDLMVNYASNFILGLDKGEAFTLLAGVHVGCFVLFGREDVRGIAGLKGRTVGVPGFGTGPDLLLSLMAAEVGLDPKKDLRWIADPAQKPKDLFIEGKIDAFLATPPEPQELRARHIGHVIFNSVVDRPWSQYFCCMLVGNGDYVHKYPVATKRVLRAILKGADLCASEPARVAQRLVDRGFTDRYDYSLDALSSIPYGAWREYDPEDSLRYYALRLHETGFIKSIPNKIFADNTDWRFLNELKR